MKNLKLRRGFSLVELMVVVAIMGTLAAIAIPAYNEYRKSAKKTAYKTDLLSLHKGILAFGVELDSYCERETDPSTISLKNVGMSSLFPSNLYGPNPGKNNFIGFGAFGSADCGTWTPATHIHSLNTVDDDAIVINDTAGRIDTDCTLDVTEYEMGVFGHISGKTFYGLVVNQNGVVTDASAYATSPVEEETHAGRVCV